MQSLMRRFPSAGFLLGLPAEPLESAMHACRTLTSLFSSALSLGICAADLVLWSASVLEAPPVLRAPMSPAAASASSARRQCLAAAPGELPPAPPGCRAGGRLFISPCSQSDALRAPCELVSASGPFGTAPLHSTAKARTRPTPTCPGSQSGRNCTRGCRWSRAR